jgi:hypothetical protein
LEKDIKSNKRFRGFRNPICCADVANCLCSSFSIRDPITAPTHNAWINPHKLNGSRRNKHHCLDGKDPNHYFAGLIVKKEIQAKKKLCYRLPKHGIHQILISHRSFLLTFCIYVVLLEIVDSSECIPMAISGKVVDLIGDGGRWFAEVNEQW